MEGRPAQHVLVCGPQGAGKSWLLWHGTQLAGEGRGSLVVVVWGVGCSDCRFFCARCSDRLAACRAYSTPATPSLRSVMTALGASLAAGCDKGLRVVEVTPSELHNLLDIARGCARCGRRCCCGAAAIC